MDAVLVGKGTLLADDPLLTARPPGPRTATRVVLTATGDGLPASCRLLDTAADAPVHRSVPAHQGCAPGVDHGWLRSTRHRTLF